MRVQGWDLSMNHAGFVELEDGELSRFWFITDRAGTAKRSKRGIRFKFPDVDPHRRGMYRLELWEKFFEGILLRVPPDLVAIEGYAYEASSRLAEMGELGGIARRLLWRANIPFRAYGPGQIKKLATHDGGASKDDMIEVVRERWGADFSGIDDPKAQVTVKIGNTKTKVPFRQTEEDLSDAFAAAKLAWVEHQLRVGLVSLSDLDPKEIQIFNTTTKKRPVNLLALEWTKRHS